MKYEEKVGWFTTAVCAIAVTAALAYGHSVHAEAETGCHKNDEGAWSCTTKEVEAKAAKVKKWYYSEDTKPEPTVKVITTAYNSVPEQTDSTPCISADGTDICVAHARGERTCAAAFPFGTVITIPGVGDCIVHDRLARKYATRVDIHFGGRDTITAARNYGKQVKEVTIHYPAHYDY